MIKLSLHSWLGSTLESTRNRLGLKQVEVAIRASISVPTVRNLERNTGTLTSLFAVLDVLGLRIVGRTLPPADDIGRAIALLRRRHRLGQRELAQLCQVTQPTIVGLEKHSTGRVSTLITCLDVLHATPSLIDEHATPSFYTSTATASVNHLWTTPPHILESLTAIFGIFDLDPCATGPQARHAFARVHLGIEENGLLCDWRGFVFVNPPYGKALPLWLAKASAEATTKRCLIVALVPARTDTTWWHRHVAGQADILMLRGRLKFGDGANSAPFPSALVFWNCPSHIVAELPRHFGEGWLVRRQVRG